MYSLCYISEELMILGERKLIHFSLLPWGDFIHE
jgi:hypothetical protein